MLIIEEKHKKQQVVNKKVIFLSENCLCGDLFFNEQCFSTRDLKTRDIALNSIIYKQLQFKETYSTTL